MRFRWMVPALALCLLLAACGGTGTERLPVNPPEEAATETAVLEGEAVSPDGRFLARIEGIGESLSDQEVSPAERVEIADAETGEVFWRGTGFCRQFVLWSPQGSYALLLRENPDSRFITVVGTESWTEWEFAAPDGTGLQTWMFLPQDRPWCEWQSDNCLDLALGWGNGGAKHCETYTIELRDDPQEGIIQAESRKRLPGSYDFDHDGEPETVEVAVVSGDKARNEVGWYELRVRTPDNQLDWSRSLHESHPGWGAYFACRVDGEDYLLRYLPTMYQGFATYAYELFFLDEAGEEQAVRQGRVEFDMNFGPYHQRFEPAEIAAFLEEVHGLTDGGQLLLTTENGNVRTDRPGGDFTDDLEYWTEEELYDESRSLEENIRAIGSYWEEVRTAE